MERRRQRESNASHIYLALVSFRWLHRIKLVLLGYVLGLFPPHANLLPGKEHGFVLNMTTNRREIDAYRSRSYFCFPHLVVNALKLSEIPFSLPIGLLQQR